jgi:hypothetical protein
MSDLPYRYGYPIEGDWGYEAMMEEKNQIDAEDQANEIKFHEMTLLNLALGLSK